MTEINGADGYQQRYFLSLVMIDLITDRERTLLQLFISSRLFGGMGEALGVLHNHLVGLDLEKLVTHALSYNKISVAKRLGWALEREGVKAVAWKPLLKVPATGYHLLDPSLPRRGACDRRWMLQYNFVASSSR